MFYNSGAYNGQQATHLPELDTLPILIQQDFKGSEWDKIYRVDFIRRTTECCGKLLDFGCSWGYGTYQYKNIGFETVGLEINRSQVEFGRTHLKLDLYSEWKELGNIYFDVILADHSLEHLSNLKETLDAFQTYSKEGSKLIIFVPNGNSNQTRHFGPKWGVGEPHTVLFTMEWFLKNLPRHHFSPHFFTPRGDTLPTEEYLSDESEIALVATRV